MSEEQTFMKLKQIPYEEMNEHLKGLSKSHPPMFQLGNSSFETRKHELVRHYERLQCLEKYGWTLEEFVLESEKRVILSAIDQFNKEHLFPLELVERAKEFFPNARFTQAKIELE